MKLFVKIFQNILRQETDFDWTIEQQKRFDETKNLISEQKLDTIPYSNQSFHCMRDASNFTKAQQV